MEPVPGEITKLLYAMRQGDPDAEGRLIPLVYADLKRIAAQYMQGERRDHSLQPTALVNEAYLKLHKTQSIDWESRSHFFAISANIMRRILIDHARAKQAGKRGGVAFVDLSLDESRIAAPVPTASLIELDDALERLAQLDPRQANIVEMKFFMGLKGEEIGHALGISDGTVKREWKTAKLFLQDRIHKDRGNQPA